MKLLLPFIIIFAFLGFLNYPQKVDATANDVVQQETRPQVQLPFSEKLRIARVKKQLSYEEIAQKAEISTLAIQNIENGKTVPVAEVQEKIEKAIGKAYFQH